jgi:hypothetical protein
MFVILFFNLSKFFWIIPKPSIRPHPHLLFSLVDYPCQLQYMFCQYAFRGEGEPRQSAQYPVPSRFPLLFAAATQPVDDVAWFPGNLQLELVRHCQTAS